ncbi:uncharacterized protein V6R79_018745 [Siganus canaliculatus]
MFLQFYLNENGDRVYTLKGISPSGQPTRSAHPARFSPDDKFSRHRVTVKKRFGLLLTQQPRPVLYELLFRFSLSFILVCIILETDINKCKSINCIYGSVQ